MSHAVAIRLRDEGLGDHVIAVALELDDDQIPMLMHIADSKLSRLLAADVSSGESTGRGDLPPKKTSRQRRLQ